MGITFAAVADDDTGATDLAGMLAEQGVRTLLSIDLPRPERLAAWAEECDAVIIGVASRAASPAIAYESTRAAMRLLRPLRPRVTQIKYCSTFDSTVDGNIGSSIDAAMDESGEPFTIVLAALPVNGRTTYMGYHFVGQQLLSDSPMRHHPLTPMTNPNLVTHLQAQTRRRVGLAPYPVVMAGAARLRDYLGVLRQSGVNIAVIDCTCHLDLAVVCEAVSDQPLITGSSAPAMELPPLWARAGWWQPTDRALLLPAPAAGGRGILIVAGSCSQATRRQNMWLAEQGARTIELDGVELVASEPALPDVLSAAVAELEAGRTCLLRTASSPEDVERVHDWARSHASTETEAGRTIASRLAALVREAVGRVRPAGVVVAGGETAGAICRALHFEALRVGGNIEPGVPLCVSLGEPSLPVVLKSGNFGSPDFYGRAVAAIRNLHAAGAAEA